MQISLFSLFGVRTLHVSDALLPPLSGALQTVTAATGVSHGLG